MERNLDRPIRRRAAICHLTSLSAGLWFGVPLLLAPLNLALAYGACLLLVPPGMVLTGPITTWFYWRLRRSQHPFLEEQGKTAFNFQCSWSLYLGLTLLLWVIGLFQFSHLRRTAGMAASVYGTTVMVGLTILPLMILTGAILAIVAAVRASKGQGYRYPFMIRFWR